LKKLFNFYFTVCSLFSALCNAINIRSERRAISNRCFCVSYFGQLYIRRTICKWKQCTSHTYM